MRFFALAAVTVLLPAVAALAQLGELEKSTPKERAGVQTQFMKEKLDLTPDQLSQVEALNLSYAEKAEPILQSEGGRVREAMALRTLQQEKDGKLKDILTPEQMTKYDAAKAELRDMMAQKLEARGAKPDAAPAP